VVQETDAKLRELAQDHRNRFWGKYRATVLQVLTGADLGKLVVSAPDIYGSLPSPQVWPCVPFAGPKHGFFSLPEIGDGVWIEFEGGNPSQPIWTGGWWVSGDLTSVSNANTRSWFTSKGLQIVMDDGQQQLSLIHPGGASIVLTQTDITLSISSTQLKLDATGISITGDVKVGS
jgi:Type VI secretion system/phage-baseplate injector OB domain